MTAVGLAGARRVSGLSRRVRTLVAARAWLLVAGLAALLAASLALRTLVLGAWYWTDEGISVGIAGHPLLAIPGLLRLDGSPPLYYLVLHAWIAAFGVGEAATHALSLVFALLTVPAGLWAGRSLFGAWAGWICAALAALNPFLTVYAQETRMYALVALLGMVATAGFLHVFAFARRRYLPVFSIALALLLYTHAWGLFLATGFAAGIAVCVLRASDRRRTLLDAALGLGATAVLFLPWLPTLLWQAQHTGAPWSQPSTLRSLEGVFLYLLGGERGLAIAAVGAGAGLLTLPYAGRRTVDHVAGRAAPPLGGEAGGAPLAAPAAAAREGTSALALIAVLAASIAAAYLASKLSPGWVSRYFAVFLSPLLLLVALGMARAGWPGLAAVATLALLWAVPQRAPDNYKSNARAVARVVAPALRPGDLVLSPQPEQVPLLAVYLPRGVSYATPLGAVRDPGVVDWTDALGRLRRGGARSPLALVRRLPAGTRLVLVRPLGGAGSMSPWNDAVRLRSAQWARRLSHDPGLAPERSTSLARRPGQRAPISARMWRVREQPAG